MLRRHLMGLIEELRVTRGSKRINLQARVTLKAVTSTNLISAKREGLHLL